MNALTRWVPRLLLALAAVHFLYALVEVESAWGDIAGDGFFRTAVDHDAPHFIRREYSLYFFTGGFFFLALGTLARLAVRTTGQLPAQIGWYLLVSGALLCVIEFPVTGGWAMVAIGLLALAARRRSNPAPGSGA